MVLLINKVVAQGVLFSSPFPDYVILFRYFSKVECMHMNVSLY